VNAGAGELLLQPVEDASGEVDGADEFVGAHVVRQTHDQIVDLGEAGDERVGGTQPALQSGVERVGGGAVAVDVVVGHLALERRSVSGQHLLHERVRSHAKVAESLRITSSELVFCLLWYCFISAAPKMDLRLSRPGRLRRVRRW
jgi:hypothetical protein